MASPPYKISSKYTKRLKFIKGFLCTHLRSLNVRNFGMAEATRLKNMASRLPSMQAKFHENPPSLQKLLVGDTQADW
jgi:hypothetical protein